MGYYTYYELRVEASENTSMGDIKPLIEEIEVEEFELDVLEWDTAPFYNLQKVESGTVLLEAQGESKWYNHTSEMRHLSKRFPSLVFVLEGSGEDTEVDKWIKTYKNGEFIRYQIAEVTFVDAEPIDTYEENYGV